MDKLLKHEERLQPASEALFHIQLWGTVWCATYIFPSAPQSIKKSLISDSKRPANMHGYVDRQLKCSLHSRSFLDSYTALPASNSSVALCCEETVRGVADSVGIPIGLITHIACDASQNSLFCGKPWAIIRLNNNNICLNNQWEFVSHTPLTDLIQLC